MANKFRVIRGVVLTIAGFGAAAAFIAARANREAAVPPLANIAHQFPLPELRSQASFPVDYGAAGYSLPYTWLDNEHAFVTTADGTHCIIDTQAGVFATTGFDVPSSVIASDRYSNAIASPKGDHVLKLLNYKTVAVLATGAKHTLEISARRDRLFVWWRPDGQGWYDTNPRLSRTAVFYTPLAGKPSSAPIGFLSAVDGSKRVLGMLPDGRVLLLTGGGPQSLNEQADDASADAANASAIELSAVDIHGQNVRQTFTIPTPPNAQCAELAVSPDVSHIAWLFYVQQPAHFNGTWASLPFNHPAATHEMEVAVSDLTGAHFHMVASTPVDGAPQSGDQDAPRYMQWLPDNKSVSLISGDSLYTFPATADVN